MEEARWHVLNHIFVLGGWAALCGRVGVTLVANGHFHGKPQALLVNSPTKNTETSQWALWVCNWQMERSVTQCASQHPGFHNLLSRWLFYLLSHGRWPRLRRHHHCSHRRPHRPNTGAAKQFLFSQTGNKWKQRLMVSVHLRFLATSRVNHSNDQLWSNKLHVHHEPEFNWNYSEAMWLSWGAETSS